MLSLQSAQVCVVDHRREEVEVVRAPRLLLEAKERKMRLLKMRVLAPSASTFHAGKEKMITTDSDGTQV